MTTKLPKVIIINKKEYMNADDVKLFDPSEFRGCSKGFRKFISRKQLSNKYYILAYQTNNAWTISDKTYKKSKLLLLHSWVKK